MSMFIMNGQTFLDKYIHEDPELVLRTQYVIVSSLIRKAGRYENQVIVANNVLYPPERLILDTEDYKSEDYVIEYTEYLTRGALPFLATLVSYTLDNSDNIVFLCGKKEWEKRYLQILKKVVLEEFGFHIYDYKKVKSGKEKIVEDNESSVSSICRKILKDAKKAREEKQLSTDKGRQEYIEELDKSKLEKELKRRNLYVKSMSKSEMKETLSVFL